MSIKVYKEKIIVKDMEFGLGTVTQQRDLGNGLEDIIEDQINASHVPYTDTQSIFDGLEDRYTKGNIDTALAQKSDKANTLLKNNTSSYVPTDKYNPATKDYVDNKVFDVGSGDMAKVIYDKDDSGVVDNSERLGDISSDDALLYRGTITDITVANKIGIYTADSITGLPTLGKYIISTVSNGNDVAQSAANISTGISYFKTLGNSWLKQTVIVQDNLTSSERDSALSALQGKILDDIKLDKSDFNDHTNDINDLLDTKQDKRTIISVVLPTYEAKDLETLEVNPEGVGSDVVITLPSTPSNGATVSIINIDDVNTHGIIVKRGDATHKILGELEDGSLNCQGCTRLYYVRSIKNWIRG